MWWVLAAAGAWELAWWNARLSRRQEAYARARAEADALGRPLVVVGAPDAGASGGYGCGDITVDLAGSACPNTRRWDVTRRTPLEDDSVVVLVCCVLEYVDDAGAAWRELTRVSGGRLHVVRVEPWTLTAYVYPGARRTLPAWVERSADV